MTKYKIIDEEGTPEKRCVPLPVGCGKVIDGFDDELSVKEYGISGLCQECQDEVFAETEEDWSDGQIVLAEYTFLVGGGADQLKALE